MKNTFRSLLCLFWLSLSFIWAEMILKIWAFGRPQWSAVVLTVLLAAAIGLLCTLLCCGANGFSNGLFCCFMALGLLIVSVQIVYYKIFRTFLTVYSFTGADKVMADFAGQALQGITASLPALAPVWLPFFLWLIFGKRLRPVGEIRIWFRAISGFGFLLVHLSALILLMCSASGIMSPKYLYSDGFVPQLSVNHFGAMTTLRVDLRELMLAQNEPTIEQLLAPEEAPADTPSPSPELPVRQPEDAPEAEQETPDNTGPNVLEIDFSALAETETDPTLKDMHSYFAQTEPTEKNEYTGLFEGKNLIWIIAEGFSSWALDESITPTLCKLSEEGFRFSNFYTPLWGVSTSDGEYVTLTGLLPKTGVWSFSKSSRNYMAFSLGNLLKSKGYTSLAYHNHSYTYYDRHLSHPNMGYSFTGIGNGLELTEQWPASDLEMIEATVNDYVNHSPFHVYYLTVSGHMYYTFSGNAMSYKHMDSVAHLPYSEGPRAYLASNMELDLALEALLEALEAAGVLEDTVIALSGDHYPYGLELNEIAELNGGAVDTAFELYRSSFILWSGDMQESITAEKPCSSLDIMPTLANLFALPYDSRLIMGRDILSDSDPLVVFYDHSFITDKGRYNAAADSFTSVEGLDWTAQQQSEYARGILDQVNQMFRYSAAILDQDYYAKVLMK